MNNRLLIVAAVILLLGGGYYFMNAQKSGTPGTDGTSETSSGPKSLKELIAGGVTQKCTFSTTDASGSSEGTTYLAGGKTRTDFTNVVSGKTTSSHMIVDGSTSYIWADGQKTGFKTTYEATSDAGDMPVMYDSDSQGSLDLNEKLNYNCSTWITDSSVFTPPADVQFSDFSQMFNPSAIPSY